MYFSIFFNFLEFFHFPKISRTNPKFPEMVQILGMEILDEEALVQAVNAKALDCEGRGKTTDGMKY